MSKPVFVTGCPRSRTSLTMDILQRCGMFIGNVCGPTKANPNGQFENVTIISQVQKAYLRKIKADPKLQRPLPIYNDLIPDPDRRKKVLQIMKGQGLKDQKVWGFKICKGVADWPIWDEAFPEAAWVIVRRDPESIVKSVQNPKARFMDGRKGDKQWMEWVEYHLQRFEDMKSALECYEIWSDRLIKGIFTDLEFLPKIGLTFKEKAKKAIDHSLTSIIS